MDYMAPEQVRGQVVDARADVFSFGVILYEAATRRRPFSADSKVETMHRILHDVPASIEAINPEVPAELRRLIRRCMAKDPNQRPQSMRDLALELREIVDEYDALSSSSSSAGQPSPRAGSPHRSGKPAALAATLVVVALVVAAWAIWRPDARRAPDSTNLRIHSETTRGDVSLAALSPDGRYLAYASGPAGQTSLWVRQLQSGAETQSLPPQGPRILGFDFTADGSYLLFTQADSVRPNYKALYQISTLGGKPRKRVFNVDTAPGVARDGKHVAFLRVQTRKHQDDLVVYDLQSGQERVVATEEWPNHLDRKPAWSPDGSRIAVVEYYAASTKGGQGWRAVVFDARDGHRRIVGPDSLNIFEIAWLPNGREMLWAAQERSQIGALTPQAWLVEYPGGRTRRLTNDLASYETVSLSADGGTIAAVHASEFANLWVADVASAEGGRQITFGSSPDKTPMLGPPLRDTTIVFLTGPDQRTLKRMEPDGSGERTILSGALFGWMFSANDQGVVYSKYDPSGVAHLFSCNLEGDETRQLLNLPGGEVLMDLSPDGRTILFSPRSRREEIWIQPLGGGDPVRLAANAMTNTGRAVDAGFSPDGRLVAYPAYREVGGTARRIWYLVSATDGTPVDTLMLPSASWDEEWDPGSDR